jgi:FMN reductase
MYLPDTKKRSANATRITTALARAHGVVIASPGYHGAPSGLIKNVLDYVEDLREHACPYLDGRAVGLITCASGWQATSTTLMSLRSIVHSLRGWPTPLAVTINSSERVFSADGTPLNAKLGAQLQTVAAQVVGFAWYRNPPLASS